MAYSKSFFDKISDELSPIKRKLSNIRTAYLGTKTKVIRIKQESKDAFGDITYSYQSNTIDNVDIRYPSNNIEIFATKDTSSLDNTAFDLLQFLPITMYVPWDNVTDEYISGTAIELDENDIIVDLKKDHHDNIIPIVMQVKRMYGNFFGNNMERRKYELSLMYYQEIDEIQDIIDDYIASGEA